MGLGRAALIGTVAGLLVAALAITGVVAFRSSDRVAMAQPGNLLLVVVAAHTPQSAGRVASLIVLADAAGSSLRLSPIDPGTTVTVPGTSAAQLRDAYAFGGGAGVSRAWAQRTGERPVPAVTIDERALLAFCEKSGPIPVAIPGAYNAFDGDRFYGFTAGRRMLSGREIVVLLSIADYSGGGDAVRIRTAVATALVDALRSRRPQAEALRVPGVSSTLSADELVEWAARARGALDGATLAVEGR